MALQTTFIIIDFVHQVELELGRKQKRNFFWCFVSRGMSAEILVRLVGVLLQCSSNQQRGIVIGYAAAGRTNASVGLFKRSNFP